MSKKQVYSRDEMLIRQLLKLLGENPDREGLRDTPRRVLKSLKEMTSGNQQTEEGLFTLFDAQLYDEMVIVKDIPVTSLCEHHLLPFSGVVHIGYVPKNFILGLSKFPRLVEVYARRCQVQERLTQQIANVLHKHLTPRGLGVVMDCTHTCMEIRGVKTHGARTITSCLLGTMKDEIDCRQEFMRLIQ